MDIGAIATTAANAGDADFVIGVIVGVGLGLVLGPVLRTWLSFREWRQASREERLADQLVERLERDAERAREDEPSWEVEQTADRSAWRTPR